MRAQSAVLFLSLLAMNSSAADKTLSIPPDLAPMIQRSITLGRALYFQDKVSAVGTDALEAKIGSLREKGLIGYLTVQQGDETGKPLPLWLVMFFVDVDQPKVAYRVKVPTEKGRQPEVETLSKPEEPSADYLTLFRARQTALKAVQPFEQPLNPAIFPAEIVGEKGILVELLAGTTKPDTVVMGKHYRVIVSPDGNEVTNVMPLTKSILELPKGSGAEGLFVTHLVTDYPLETHVFASMLSRVPLYVGTGRGVWLVNGPEISLVSKEGKRSK